MADSADRLRTHVHPYRRLRPSTLTLWYVDESEEPLDELDERTIPGMWWRHLLAGATAGAVSRTCTAPLDRLKVFLQVRGAEFQGLTAVLRHMLNEGGLLSLWRGNGINVVKNAPEIGIKFLSYEQAKRLIKSHLGHDLSIVDRFLAGSFAGGVSQTVIYPLEVVKTRLCLRNTGQYKGVVDCTRQIYAENGLKSFYRGYLPNLIGIFPYAGTDLAVYETLKNWYISHYNESHPSTGVLLTCGTISSTCGQLVSYPLALVRTRLQTHSDRHQSMIGLFRHIVATQGFIGLYRGIIPNAMKVAPAVSISYVVYENTREFLGASMS